MSETYMQPNTKYGYDRSITLHLCGVSDINGNKINVDLDGGRISVDADGNPTIDGWDKSYIVHDDGSRTESIPCINAVDSSISFEEYKGEEKVLYNINKNGIPQIYNESISAEYINSNSLKVLDFLENPFN